jgi:hypothetical protein
VQRVAFVKLKLKLRDIKPAFDALARAQDLVEESGLMIAGKVGANVDPDWIQARGFDLSRALDEVGAARAALLALLEKC